MLRVFGEIKNCLYVKPLSIKKDTQNLKEKAEGVFVKCNESITDSIIMHYQNLC